MIDIHLLNKYLNPETHIILYKFYAMYGIYIEYGLLTEMENTLPIRKYNFNLVNSCITNLKKFLHDIDVDPVKTWSIYTEFIHVPFTPHAHKTGYTREEILMRNLTNDRY